MMMPGLTEFGFPQQRAAAPGMAGFRLAGEPPQQLLDFWQGMSPDMRAQLMAIMRLRKRFPNMAMPGESWERPFGGNYGDSRGRPGGFGGLGGLGSMAGSYGGGTGRTASGNPNSLSGGGLY